MSRAGLDLSAVRAVSVSGQQHGTVYWAKGAQERLRAMAADSDSHSSDLLSGQNSPGSSSSGSGGGGVDSAVGGSGGGGIGAVAVAEKATSTKAAAVPGGAGLVEAFSGCFAVEDSPIWADGSTKKYAAELEEAMGGATRLAELTGSRAHLRQGAPQIMKVAVVEAGRGGGRLESKEGRGRAGRRNCPWSPSRRRLVVLRARMNPSN